MENISLKPSSGLLTAGAWLYIIGLALWIVRGILLMVYPEFFYGEWFQDPQVFLLTYSAIAAIQVIALVMILFGTDDFYLKAACLSFILGAILGVFYFFSSVYQFVEGAAWLMILLSYLPSIVEIFGLTLLCCSRSARTGMRNVLVLAVGMYVASVVMTLCYVPARMSLHSLYVPALSEFYIPMTEVMSKVIGIFCMAVNVALIVMWYRISKVFASAVPETGNVKERLVGALTSRYFICILATVAVAVCVYFILWNVLTSAY